jgi:RHS repeat-associated protein
MDFNSSGALLYRYIYGNAIDFLIGRMDTSGNAMWYLTDKLGSVRENTNGSGNVLDSITYDTFGNILAETHPTSGDRFKYTSREWDSEIGQYFYRARYYSATDGRFESEDPSGFSAGDSDLYRYVNNAPTGLTDDTGLGTYIWGVRYKAEVKGSAGQGALPDTVIMKDPERLEGFWYEDPKVGVPEKPDFWIQEHVRVKKKGTGWFIGPTNVTEENYMPVSDFKVDDHYISPAGIWSSKVRPVDNPANRTKALNELVGEIRASGGTGKIVYEQWFTSSVKPSKNPPGKKDKTRVVPNSGFQITYWLIETTTGFALTVQKEGKSFVVTDPQGTGVIVNAGTGGGQEYVMIK